MGILDSGRRLDAAIYNKLGLGKLPAGLRTGARRYLPVTSLLTIVVLLAVAISGGGTSKVTTDKSEAASEPGTPGGEASPTAAAPVEPAQQNAAAAKKARAISSQRVAPATANVCGNNNILNTGPKVQYPYAVQCVPKFDAKTADNGGTTHRGVYQDKIRVALYVTADPTILATTAAAQGCNTDECFTDWGKAFVEWFLKYYETYGRNVEVVPIRGSGPASNSEVQTRDAQRIINIDPPVFASLDGPGIIYARELQRAGIMCFCTASLPQEQYDQLSPFVYSTLMASNQAYVHRVQYIGERLAGRKAIYAGDEVTKNRTREFTLLWYDTRGREYESGVQFFKKQLKDKYNINLEGRDVRYEEIEGCQTTAPSIATQLAATNPTTVLVASDPLCLIPLTNYAESPGGAKWEWLVMGSTLTDTNALARLYEKNQWSRAFGISMLAPVVKDEASYQYKMFKEVRPDKQWYVNIPLTLANIAIFFRGVHLAGPKLTPGTFKDGMAKGITRGGTVTLPESSFGPKNLPAFNFNFWDHNSFNDMTELWWDNTAADANGTARAYRYVDGGKRYVWGSWPSSEVKAFQEPGTITGFQKAPDQ